MLLKFDNPLHSFTLKQLYFEAGPGKTPVMDRLRLKRAMSDQKLNKFPDLRNYQVTVAVIVSDSSIGLPTLSRHTNFKKGRKYYIILYYIILYYTLYYITLYILFALK